ncbi:MAG: beta-lactamase family protein [Bacteroidota bacterium]|nr:beta-lactamase family protein [Bacteroidota bacterium]
MKALKNILIGIVIIIALANLLLFISGKTYLYKGIANTYLKGRSGPSITEFDIFSKREIKAGAPQAWNISTNYNSIEIPDSSIQKIQSFKTVSYLVVKNDSILHEQYWEGFDKQKLSNSFSMAKTIVGILTGVAIKEGKIQSLDQAVGDFLPEFKEGKKSEITIRHLMTMSAGLDFDEDYASPFAYPAQAYYGTDLRSLTLKYNVKEEPGEIFRYLSGDTQLLSFVLAEATGKTISEYASEKLWKPMGAENSAYWNLDSENGSEKAYCCFISNARDFARLGKLYLNFGNWNGNQLIDSVFVAESIIPAKLVDNKGEANKKYGLKWWLVDYKEMKIFYARGILGQYIICIPEKNMIIVRLGHKREANPSDAHPSDLFVYIDAAMLLDKK